jgi:hypothetical protein
MGLEEKDLEVADICKVRLSWPRQIRLRHDMLICEHKETESFLVLSQYGTEHRAAALTTYEYVWREVFKLWWLVQIVSSVLKEHTASASNYV